MGNLSLRSTVTTAERGRPGSNALLVAARWPLRRARLQGGPCEPGRWVVVEVAAPLPFVLGVMHVPNRAGGRKYPFLDAVLTCARRWRLRPAGRRSCPAPARRRDKFAGSSGTPGSTSMPGR